MKYVYTAILTPLEDGSYEARIPDIEHCVSSGHDLADALAMIADAGALMLTCYEDDNLPLPVATPHQDVIAPDGSISSLVTLDTAVCRIMSDTRAVRKNVSLPAWMATMAEKRGVNCSQVLQDALRRLLV